MAIETTTKVYEPVGYRNSRVLCVVSGSVDVQIKKSDGTFADVSTTAESLELTSADILTYRIVPTSGATYEVL